MINKKRGYKSSRKAKSDDEGTTIDGMEVAKLIYDNDLTPGEYVYNLLTNGKKHIPDFYRSDLQSELDKIWSFQRQFNVEVLTDILKEEIRSKSKKQTWAILQKPFGLIGVKRETKGAEQKKENFQWRTKALSERLSLEELAIVLQEINGQINNSSGYLGAISDRSKELYFNNLTVGQYLYNQIKEKIEDPVNQFHLDWLEDILNVKYGSAKDTMLKFETYVMYNTSDKAVFLPTVRDRKLRVISGYINLNNVAEPNSEF